MIPGGLLSRNIVEPAGISTVTVSGIRVALVMPGGYRTEIGEKFPTRYLDTTAYPYNLQARFDAANASFNEREDLTPVVEAVLEAATASEPEIRYPVPGGGPSLPPIIAGLKGHHETMRRLMTRRGRDD